MIAVAFVLEGVLALDDGLAADLVPAPGSGQTLHELETLAIPHAVLACGPIDVARAKAAGIGFGGRVVAEPVRVPGAERTAFADLSDALRLPLGQIFFVATDRKRDIEPAQRAGMRTVWLADRTSVPVGGNAPEFVIERLADVLDVLREPYTRSLLGLRYILHSVASWRSGTFIAGTEYGSREAKP